MSTESWKAEIDEESGHRLGPGIQAHRRILVVGLVGKNMVADDCAYVPGPCTAGEKIKRSICRIPAA